MRPLMPLIQGLVFDNRYPSGESLLVTVKFKIQNIKLSKFVLSFEHFHPVK